MKISKSSRFVKRKVHVKGSKGRKGYTAIRHVLKKGK